MLKNILHLEGVLPLNKTEQKSIHGGRLGNVCKVYDPSICISENNPCRYCEGEGE